MPHLPQRTRERNSRVFLLTLEGTRGDAVRNLRALLKIALRGFALRCVSAEEVGHDDREQQS
jgi:hypothetical protein